MGGTSRVGGLAAWWDPLCPSLNHKKCLNIPKSIKICSKAEFDLLNNLSKNFWGQEKTHSYYQATKSHFSKVSVTIFTRNYLIRVAYYYFSLNFENIWILFTFLIFLH